MTWMARFHVSEVLAGERVPVPVSQLAAAALVQGVQVLEVRRVQVRVVGGLGRHESHTRWVAGSASISSPRIHGSNTSMISPAVAVATLIGAS